MPDKLLSQITPADIETARRRIEDALIEFRDLRVSLGPTVGIGHGLVVKEPDGRDSREVLLSSAPCASIRGVTLSLDWDLLDRLDAAATDSAAVHHDLCTVFRDGGPCSCGYPQLLIDVAGFVRSLAVESAVTQAQRAV